MEPYRAGKRFRDLRDQIQQSNRRQQLGDQMRQVSRDYNSQQTQVSAFMANEQNTGVSGQDAQEGIIRVADQQVVTLPNVQVSKSYSYFSSLKKNGYNNSLMYTNSIPRPVYTDLYYHKIHGVHNILYDTAVSRAQIMISWCGDGVTTSKRIFISANQTFDHFRNRFRQFTIVGMRLEIQPMCEQSINMANPNRTYATDCWIGSNTAFAPLDATSLDAMIEYKDFKTYHLGGTISRFYNVRSLIASKDELFFDSQQSMPQAGTLIVLNSQNWAASMIAATVHVTWYCIFKGVEWF